jgi:hypothetical protein
MPTMLARNTMKKRMEEILQESVEIGHASNIE